LLNTSIASYQTRIAISAYTPPAFDGPVWGYSRGNMATPFGVEKLEWCGNQVVKKFRICVIRFDIIQERDRQTDRQTDGHRITA